MAHLYEIQEQYESLLNAIAEGEIPEEAINDTLESIESEFSEKADNIACYIKSIYAEVDAIKEEAATLTERAKIKEHKVEKLKEYLLSAMKALKKDKIETTRNVIKVGICPPSVSIDGENESKFIEWAKNNNKDLITEKSPTINKTAIKELLKKDKKLPYCSLIRKDKITIK